MIENNDFIRLVPKGQDLAAADAAPSPDVPQDKLVGEQGEEPIETLRYRIPATNKEFTELNGAQVHRLTHMVMNHIDQLCAERKSTVDCKYWKAITKKIFSSLFVGKPLVCPALAGAGKSTWILAFILAMCELQLNSDPLADALGGVILVLQKVETLNEVVTTVQRHFADTPEELIVALQSWTKSGQEYGYCENKQVVSYTECLKDQCPYAATCALLKFRQAAGRAYVLCMTQARFGQFRRDGSIEKYMTREDGTFPRRFLIFDEKFDFAPVMELTQEVINKASTELERLVNTQNVTDREISNTQLSVDYQIGRRFRRLRSDTVFMREDRTIDSPYGLCSLKDDSPDERHRFQQFTEYLFGRGHRYHTHSLSICVDVISALFQGDCLYTKMGAFSILHAGEPQLSYGSALTLVFDATAEVDGDYRGLGVEFLPHTDPRHMKKVTFYIYTHADLNASRSAMKKAWKLPAFCQIIEEIMAQHTGRTFLCTYKEFAEYFPAHLSKSAMDRILLMDGMDPPCIPYWGGNNGSNSFNKAVNCILVGYPRLNVRTYLQRAYTYWGDRGIRQQIIDLCNRWQSCSEPPSGYIQSSLPDVGKYEASHLAARLEQEIYRCQLRNQECLDPICVFLFAPPAEVEEILLSRFPGANVKYIEELPDSVTLVKGTDRTYDGKPTNYARLSTFLERWDGSETPLDQFLDEAGITKSGWKALRKEAHFRGLCATYGVRFCGRGPNVTICREEKNCA